MENRMASLIHKEQVVKWLLRGARAGATMADCGASVGITGGTISSWLKRGEAAIAVSQETETNVSEDDFPYAKFYADWMQAYAEARIDLLEDLRDHHDWRAKVQWLARTSDNYKDVDKKQIEITGAAGGPIEISQLVLGAVQKLDKSDEKAAIEKREKFKALEVADAREIIEGSISNGDSSN